MAKLLVTGGCGFIGSNFIRSLLTNDPDCRLVNLDKLTYAGNRANLSEFSDDERLTFLHGDISDAALVNDIFERECFDAVINFAAETHVDRSIRDPSAFVRTNVMGTQVLLEASKNTGVERYLQISTDEVYGSLDEDAQAWGENAPLCPSSPYSASKASADLLCRSYHHTYDVPVIILRSCNAFGPYQYPEKFIPLMVHRANQNLPLPLYGDGRNIREWIYVDDLCRAIEVLVRAGNIGEIYNIGTGIAQRNIDIVTKILQLLEKPHSLIEFVRDRPGHDWRYAVDASKLRSETRWNHETEFERGLKQTIAWITNNQAWMQSVTTGDFEQYYEEVYSGESDALPSRTQ